ncbi:MAG: hypothetical protein A3H96_14715 [Acidobacteria bacterium RIFCSPLOWO2_02_FULL_67_36]|nr:MAG: hypothetical protein A3H96_14715 [Acidobacteria bacterium RIFCSPLOWO2_02_FULL_67_36]OFW18473.1 MAG: hypothetical protein A3G21_08225 [Acidobacteria bacterium RIFCSPLOWO2_12_FULL_66_21]
MLERREHLIGPEHEDRGAAPAGDVPDHRADWFRHHRKRDKRHEDGAEAFKSKPFLAEDLARLLREAIRRGTI